MAKKSISTKRRERRVSITISLSDNEEQQTKKLHDRSSKTAKSKERETEEESSQSEEESSNEDKVITKWIARKLIMLQKEMIASHKKIIALDNDIKTHDIIAAKTTPEKERMIKSKNIAAKNVVSQSPIKAVNLGDISGKASNGISNTPKDA
nr:hypothetical protein [Tanacetum cinerariifolium]